MSIFSRWNDNASPYTNCLEIRRMVMPFNRRNDAHERWLNAAGDDAAKLIALRKHYQDRCLALKSEICSMSEAVEIIDEVLARLVAHQAWLAGYEGAEEDAELTKQQRPKRAAKDPAAVARAAS